MSAVPLLSPVETQQVMHEPHASGKTSTIMPRLQLFEVEDLGWVPSSIRSGIVAALGTMMRLLGVYRRYIFPSLLPN